MQNHPGLQVSPGFSGRHGGTSNVLPPILSSSLLSSLLVSSAVKPLGGSVSSQPLSVQVAVSWCLKKWRETPFLLFRHYLLPQVPKPCDLCPVCHGTPSLSICRAALHRLTHVSREEGREPKAETFFLFHSRFLRPRPPLPIILSTSRLPLN